MKRSLALLLICCLYSPGSLAQPPELEARAREISQSLVSRLLPTLQNTLAQSGPVQAISVCAEQAPAIAQSLSAETGWTVKRVSLKPRNASSARADDWERRILMEFDRRQKAGEAPATLTASAIVDGDFRYMQAQPTMGLCLTCHGKDIDPQVSRALSEHYPFDQATGYSAGEIRGAISLRVPVP